jgi:hypothetical protein
VSECVCERGRESLCVSTHPQFFALTFVANIELLFYSCVTNSKKFEEILPEKQNDKKHFEMIIF